MQASILIEKLNYLTKQNNKRRKIARYYDNYILNKNIQKLNYSKNSVYHQYVIKVKNKAKLTNIFKKNNIQYGFHYPKSINQLECFKNYFKGKKFDNAEKLAKSCISIPIDPNLKLQEIKKIVNCVNSI